MHKHCLFLFATLLPAFAFGWETYAEFETAATNALYEVEPLYLPAFTNAARAFAMSTTNADERRTALFIGSIAEYHQTPDPEEPTFALGLWSQSLQGILHPNPGDVLHWQDVEGSAFLLEWWIGRGQANAAFAAATNLSGIVAGKTSTSPSAPLQQALVHYFNNIDLPLEQTFRYEAALSASALGDFPAATNWSVGLPSRALDVIFADEAALFPDGRQ